MEPMAGRDRTGYNVQVMVTEICSNTAQVANNIDLMGFYLSETGYGIFVPDLNFSGSHWSAAELCYKSGGAGLLDIRNFDQKTVAKDILPQLASNEFYFLASSRMCVNRKIHNSYLKRRIRRVHRVCVFPFYSI
jgi:hypothetical protein